MVLQVRKAARILWSDEARREGRGRRKSGSEGQQRRARSQQRLWRRLRSGQWRYSGPTRGLPSGAQQRTRSAEAAHRPQVVIWEGESREKSSSVRNGKALRSGNTYLAVKAEHPRRLRRCLCIRRGSARKAPFIVANRALRSMSLFSPGFTGNPPCKALELELIQSHMAQKPVLWGEVGCACVAREVSVEKGGMGERG